MTPSSRVDSELAWAAGFYDGEGCTLAHQNNRSLMATIGQVDRFNLERFMVAVGCLGTITGPQAQPNRRDIWTWRAYNGAAQNALRTIWPFLGPTKRAQALTALIRNLMSDGGYRGYRSDAATRCRRGHTYSDVGMAINNRGQRVCLACKKEARLGRLSLPSVPASPPGWLAVVNYNPYYGGEVYVTGAQDYQPVFES